MLWLRRDDAMQDFKIQNIVGSCDVKFPIRLEGLAYSHGYFCSVSPPLHAPSEALDTASSCK